MKLRTIIAGSRSITDIKFVEEAVRDFNHKGYIINEVVSGGARGVDTLGETWAKERGIPLIIFPADWETYGKMAGFKRNYEMAKYAEALILVWDGKSLGSRSMRCIAENQGLIVLTKEVK